MRTGTINKLQDLRQKIYVAAKSNKQKRFWGMYCHVTKEETLYEAYRLVKRNSGAPGIDGITFKQIEETGTGLAKFITTIKEELTDGTYRPSKNRKKEIPKANGKVRVLGIPTIKDRVVQGALKLIIEPIFEADFAGNSYPILRGWVNYYRIGHSSKEFSQIRQWVEQKVRRFVRKSQGRKGYGWKEWSSKVVYEQWGLYNDYQIRYHETKVKPA